MIIYVNGDSHAAAAEAVNSFSWAQDDGLFWGMGKRPHPDNERASFGCELANHYHAVLWCDAQAGCSNTRIMRTTREWIDRNQSQLKDTFMVIQWSTWEREEWWHNGHDFQVNASGIDHVPVDLQDQYKQFVTNIDWNQCKEQAHNDIWEFHTELKQSGVRYVMFNGNNHFAGLPEYNWGANYLDPYSEQGTYNSVLRNNGFQPVAPESWHFDANAHCFWSEYLLQYINKHNLV
jgi:hypothetical protein